MEIKDINFGKLNGHNESQEPNFSEMFYDGNGHFDVLLTTKKFLVIGRKGTGKTTLAEYFIVKGKEKKFESKILTSTNFFSNKLKEFYDSPIRKEEEVLFWKYIFLLELGNMFIEYAENAPFYRLFLKRDAKRLKLFLDRTKMSIIELVQETTENTNSQISSSLSNKDTGVSSGSSRGFSDTEKITKKKSRFFEVYDELSSEVFDFLSRNKNRYTIFYDDMDQLEEYVDMEEFRSLIKSMIYAAEEVNSELSKYNNSKIVILLRSDIVNLLQYEGNNINKTIGDLGIDIKWFNPHMKEGMIEHPLMRMVLHKIRNSLANPDIALEEVKKLYFPDEKVFKHIMERSFGRPRDIISYLIEYQEYYKQDTHFILEHMRSVETAYSSKFYAELANEIRMTGRQEEFKIIFNNISNRNYPSFKYKQLSQYMISNGEDISELLSDLSLMVSMGILGVVLKNKKAEFSYRDNLEKPVTAFTTFTLHYGLRKHFSI